MKNLYTFDLRDNEIDLTLPKVVWKLKNWRHLLVDWYSEIEGSIGLGSLSQLETLKMVQAKSLIRKEAVAALPNIRNLGIAFSTEEEAEIVLKSHSIFWRRQPPSLFLEDDDEK